MIRSKISYFTKYQHIKEKEADEGENKNMILNIMSFDGE